MRVLSVFILSVIFSYGLYAQSVDDALKYSQNTYNITARSMGMGGSFGALGGDFSSASINPAGLGVYRSGEFLISPGLGFTTVTSNNLKENNTSFILSNISYVGSKSTKSEDWKFLNFGIGYNQTNDFNRNYILQNLNSTNSHTDLWAEIATDEGVTNSSARLPFETYLINYDEDDKVYYSVLKEGDNVDQQKVISEKGNIGELVVSAAGNFKDKLYLGGTLGINTLKYSIETKYNETVDGNSELDYFDFKEIYDIKGVGVNFKVGAIFKPTHTYRFGVAIHSPSFYRIEDTYSANILSKFLNEDSEGNDTYEYTASDNTIEYNFTTPWKFIISGATIIKDKGAINVDVGFINYSNSKFEAPDNKGYFDGTSENPGVNRYIDNQLTNALNVRVGGEYKVTDDFSFRLGYGLYGNPFNTSAIKDVDLGYSTISSGFGYKNKEFYFDVAWQMFSLNDQTTLYQNSSLIKFETAKHQAKISVGWRF